MQIGTAKDLETAKAECKTALQGDEPARGQRLMTPVYYCRFDEFEDAVVSIELAAEKLETVQATPTSTACKWVILALKNAVQAAMVLALSGTDGCGALYPESQKQNRAWLANPTPERRRQRMADFNNLLQRIQRAELLDAPVPKFVG
ncbi:hypothetical protein ACVIQS_010268 [Bradyrhizobium diazoefficiens]